MMQYLVLFVSNSMISFSKSFIKNTQVPWETNAQFFENPKKYRIFFFQLQGKA